MFPVGALYGGSPFQYNMENINFVAVDFETAVSNAACQIGIVVVRKGQIVEEICKFIQPPGNKYNKHNIAIHKIKPEMTENAPNFGEIWPELKGYFEKQLVVCHNSAFDMWILDQELQRYDIPPVKMLGTNCTCKLTGEMKLEEACNFFDIEIDDHHNALSDAKACAQIFISYLISDKEIPTIKTEPIQKSSRTITKSIFLGKPTQEDFHVDESARHEKVRSDLLQQDLSGADPDSPFYDKKVVITGIFPIERNELAEIVKTMGADINTSISSKTQIVLIGEDAGPSKLNKIAGFQSKGYNIKTYNVEETMALIKKQM